MRRGKGVKKETKGREVQKRAQRGRRSAKERTGDRKGPTLYLIYSERERRREAEGVR